MNGVLVLAMTLASADPVAPPDGMTPPEKAELVKEIEGEWEVVSVCVDGSDETRNNTGRWRINGRCLADTQYRLDRLASPSQIGLIGGHGESHCGIYICSGDRLVLAYTLRSDERRPTQFTSEPGSGVVLWTLRRVKK
jgi:uncharacterized protein (TIGR03067 family)